MATGTFPIGEVAFPYPGQAGPMQWQEGGDQSALLSYGKGEAGPGTFEP